MEERVGQIRVRLIGTAIFLSALWLLMSGLFKPMILAFGVVSVLLVVYILHRMDSVDEDRVALPLGPFATVGYFFWLLVEIAKANWAVTKIVLSPKMPITQHLFSVPYTQNSDVGQVIFANSITLTPGTLTVETDLGYFLVHALDYSPDDLESLADMDAHVTAIETGRAG
ncbi:MAG: Na+/H+ antiporter subunit E [Sedimentitalea sp.]|uniref:Na+/H+ antiporter subunit E n=1 Tax=Sedimentitalea sp. TaxID=2048915 RepID=UPI003263C43F